MSSPSSPSSKSSASSTFLPFDTIVTHPGGAHTDEFLACSLLLTCQTAPILRREPTPADLASPATCVVDVGHRHEPALNNYDHHQFPRDHPPTCALSLILQQLGWYADARQFCEWLEPAEWFDTRGPIETARWLGITPETLARLNSPVQGALIRLFAQSSRVEAGQPLWEMMRAVGQDIVDYLETLRARLDHLAAHAEFWTLELAGRPAQILFLPRAEPPLEDPSFGIARFIQSRGQERDVVGVVSPDRRGAGYGLERFQDSLRLDFTRIAGRPGVHFVHARGFVAKTSVTDIAELKALLALAAADAA